VGEPLVDARHELRQLAIAGPPFFGSTQRWSEARTSPSASAIRRPGGSSGPPWSSFRIPRIPAAYSRAERGRQAHLRRRLDDLLVTRALLVHTVRDLAHQMGGARQQVQPPVSVLVDVGELAAVSAPAIIRLRLQHQLPKLDPRTPAKVRHARSLHQPLALGQISWGVGGPLKKSGG
jgi:hypothetical protein